MFVVAQAVRRLASAPAALHPQRGTPRVRHASGSAVRAVTARPAATPFCTTLDVGTGDESYTFPNLFLRDSSQHPAHLHPASQQKLFRTSDVPLDGEIVHVATVHVGSVQCLQLEWSTPVDGMEGPGAMTTLHSLDWLIEKAVVGSDLVPLPAPTPWSTESLLPTLSSTTCGEYLASPTALQAHLTSLIENGIAFIRTVPTESKAGHATSLKAVVERVGSIRKTWYGDLWDVRAEEGSRNIAYTNLDLGLHMDLTHFESPPRYQYLHSLQNTSIKGGLSYFVDAFRVAQILRESHLEEYQVLCDEPVQFEYNNGGQHTRWSRPTIELAPARPGEEDLEREVWAVNYSPPFQGNLAIPLDTTSPATLLSASHRMHSLHAALRLFAFLCDSPALQYHVQLQPGDCAVFDNRRVLHARTAFEFTDEQAQPGEERGRWLKGAYADGDEVWSRWRVGEAKRRVVTLDG